MNWRETTNEQALAAWESGASVWTCDMGGMGPGYEQCIQIMGFTMLRAMLANPVDWKTLTEGEEAKEKWREYRGMIDADPIVKAVVERLGPSGAQHGAAMNIASVFARNGYAKGMEMVPEDRRIQVSRQFPTLDGQVADAAA